VILDWGSIRLNIPRKVSLAAIDQAAAVQEYDRISRWPQFKLIRTYIVKKIKQYQIKDSLTDIGCGPGYLLYKIALELPHLHLTGVDLSPEMLIKAQTKFNTPNLKDKDTFKQGSAEHLPFEDQTQEFIISTGALHHFNNPHQALEEIYRVLKPQGQLLLFDLRRDARRIFFWLLWFVQNLVFRLMGINSLRTINEPIGSLQASYTLAEIQKIMAQTKFEEWKIEGKTAWIYVWAKKQ
jgi:ubiquinone/menaquinone biosynthesis C-methylase UbiE